MIKIDIPGRDTLEIHYLLLDYNGTVAEDGILIEGVRERIALLRDKVEIHVLTADTHGTAAKECAGLGISVDTFPREGAARFKADAAKKLGRGICAVGNGFNDIEMLSLSDLAIAVIEEEGTCAALIPHAHLLVKGINAALDLLIKPARVVAGLRS